MQPELERRQALLQANFAPTEAAGTRAPVCLQAHTRSQACMEPAGAAVRRANLVRLANLLACVADLGGHVAQEVGLEGVPAPREMQYATVSNDEKCWPVILAWRRELGWGRFLWLSGTHTHTREQHASSVGARNCLTPGRKITTSSRAARLPLSDQPPPAGLCLPEV